MKLSEVRIGDRVRFDLYGNETVHEGLIEKVLPNDPDALDRNNYDAVLVRCVADSSVSAWKDVADVVLV